MSAWFASSVPVLSVAVCLCLPADVLTGWLAVLSVSARQRSAAAGAPGAPGAPGAAGTPPSDLGSMAVPPLAIVNPLVLPPLTALPPAGAPLPPSAMQEPILGGQPADADLATHSRAFDFRDDDGVDDAPALGADDALPVIAGRGVGRSHIDQIAVPVLRVRTEERRQQEAALQARGMTRPTVTPRPGGATATATSASITPPPTPRSTPGSPALVTGPLTQNPLSSRRSSTASTMGPATAAAAAAAAAALPPGRNPGSTSVPLTGGPADAAAGNPPPLGRQQSRVRAPAVQLPQGREWASRVSFVNTPYQSLAVVFNQQNLWANIQHPDPARIEYDLDRPAHWAPFFDASFTRRVAPFFEVPRMPGRLPDARCQALEEAIVDELKASLVNFRHGMYKPTGFEEPMRDVLRKGLAALELEQTVGAPNTIEVIGSHGVVGYHVSLTHSRRGLVEGRHQPGLTPARSV
ncbi:hypothetical protein PAPYR_9500 [Paratrimastix pyriformis]|uniref:CEP76/DRC7 peptidase-like domain-containing protein n=1 Tax=Paratrimastix pyriformis TaxID=342808 RepID=A0ABQ8UD07_9EUKA|nr:hypothetical protein PAPYR_9500 [Paratrimastix pyriformis]